MAKLKLSNRKLCVSNRKLVQCCATDPCCATGSYLGYFPSKQQHVEVAASFQTAWSNWIANTGSGPVVAPPASNDVSFNFARDWSSTLCVGGQGGGRLTRSSSAWSFVPYPNSNGTVTNAGSTIAYTPTESTGTTGLAVSANASISLQCNVYTFGHAIGSSSDDPPSGSATLVYQQAGFDATKVVMNVVYADGMNTAYYVSGNRTPTTNGPVCYALVDSSGRLSVWFDASTFATMTGTASISPTFLGSQLAAADITVSCVATKFTGTNYATVNFNGSISVTSNAIGCGYTPPATTMQACQSIIVDGYTAPMPAPSGDPLPPVDPTDNPIDGAGKLLS